MKYKYPIILTYLLLLLMPFVLLRDVFPFMRLGMFAMPYVKKVNTESFAISYSGLCSSDKERLWTEKEMGLNKAHWHYLLRNHHYRGENLKLLKAIAPLLPDSVSMIRYHRKTKEREEIVASLKLPLQ